MTGSFLPFNTALMMQVFPSFLLQALAIIGILFIVLRLTFQSVLRESEQRWRIGAALGAAVFIITFVSYYDTSPGYKPQIRSDILFVSGIVSGPLGALACAALTILARLVFGGFNLLGPAIIDIALITGTGVAVGMWMARRKIHTYSFVTLVVLCVICRVVAVGSYEFLHQVNLITRAAAHEIIHYRVVMSGISFLLITGILLVLQKSHSDQTKEREERKAARVDLDADMGNRLALIEHVSDATKRTKALLIFSEVGNTSELILNFGSKWPHVLFGGLPSFLEAQERDLGGKPFMPRHFAYAENVIVTVLQNVSLEEARKARLLERFAEAVESHVRHIEYPLGVSLRVTCGEVERTDRLRVKKIIHNIAVTLRENDDKVCYADGFLLTAIEEKDEILDMILSWIKGAEPPLKFQPVVDLQSRQVVGAESLLRAVNRAGDPLPPPKVLAVCAKHNLTTQFEWACIEHIVRKLKGLAAEGRQLQITVNVSAMSLGEEDFARRVVALVKDAGIPEYWLCLELTEASHLPDTDATHANFQLLRRGGVAIALDDFGNGYSALSLLAKYEFDKIKTDWWMVANMNTPRIRDALSIAISTAAMYDIDIVVEGIERVDQLEALARMGAKLGQGYLFAPAIQLDELPTMYTITVSPASAYAALAVA